MSLIQFPHLRSLPCLRRVLLTGFLHTHKASEVQKGHWGSEFFVITVQYLSVVRACVLAPSDYSLCVGFWGLLSFHINF